MEMKRVKGILCAVVVVMTLGCLSGCSFVSKTSYLYQNGEKYTAGDREITDKIETINLDYMEGDVKLVGADTDTLTVKETSAKTLDDKRKVHTWVDGTTLYVRYCASAKRLDLNNLNKSLEITLPKDVKLGEVKLVLSSGDVNCKDFEAGTMDIEASSGNIAVDCTAKKFDMEASSGSISLVQHGDSDAIDIKVSSGNISIDMENAGRVNTHASSGDTKISAKSIKEFKAEASSGKEELRFAEVPGNTDIEVSSGDVTIYLPKDADLTADFETSSGKLSYELSFAKKGDQYVCGEGTNRMKVETSSGNITVKATE